MILVDPATGAVVSVWTDPAVGFLKGLVVVADVAYIGVNAPLARKQRDSKSLPSEIAAVDLVAHRLLWRKTVNRSIHSIHSIHLI